MLGLSSERIISLYQRTVILSQYTVKFQKDGRSFFSKPRKVGFQVRIVEHGLQKALLQLSLVIKTVSFSGYAFIVRFSRNQKVIFWCIGTDIAEPVTSLKCFLGKITLLANFNIITGKQKLVSEICSDQCHHCQGL